MHEYCQALTHEGYLAEGANFLVDGQYGSTGKGLVAALMGENMPYATNRVTSNAGPNSGHTSFIGGKKVVLQQLPSFAVAAARHRNTPIEVLLNAGAVIDPSILTREISQHGTNIIVRVHPNAAVVTESALRHETGMHERIGSTGKGVGAAIAAKVMREPLAVASQHVAALEGAGVQYAIRLGRKAPQFVEVSQGFSLSLNAGGFYPYCTSRDCTVQQALTDAGLHPRDYHQAIAVYRTFPIRVAGSSGPMYSDQQEISWQSIGQKPEITTVTKKIRRLFTWSRQQFKASVAWNRPEHLFINFMNYLNPEDRMPFLHQVISDYKDVIGLRPLTVGLGFGPKPEDVEMYQI
jgi:adenylosuccinate synthase